MEAGASRSKAKYKAGAWPGFPPTNEKGEQEAEQESAAVHSKGLVARTVEAAEHPQPTAEAAESAVAAGAAKDSTPPRPRAPHPERGAQNWEAHHQQPSNREKSLPEAGAEEYRPRVSGGLPESSQQQKGTKARKAEP